MSHWIKMRRDLPTSTSFARAAAVFVASGMDRGSAQAATIAAAYSLWSLGFVHATEDGVIEDGTREWLAGNLIGPDPDLAVEALVAAGWVVFPEDEQAEDDEACAHGARTVRARCAQRAKQGGILLPKWERHNGRMQAQQAAARERAKRSRSGKTPPDDAKNADSRSVRAACAHGARSVRPKTRLDKTRGEKTPPVGGGTGGAAGGGGDSSSRGLADRVVEIPAGAAARWTADAGAELPADLIAGLGREHPAVDLASELSAWETWYRGKDTPHANPAASVRDWVRRRDPAATPPASGPPSRAGRNDPDALVRMAADAVRKYGDAL